ncbi:unnamed protein product [Rotaria sp. Silwood2]|nr:unnamed protein product [Rotaria sp. Silwood2]CAF4304803.1 unnamed protein product [Rotaria sp. Silwood2]CAF4644280.1 unnamed protein product [Rotaria sp. Silwood2]CAF4755491.1 unnamed protein product [Rotaria sp. Silwood2]
MMCFLKLFDQAIDQLSDEDKPTIHQVIPIRQLLINYCEVKVDDSDGLKEVKCFVVAIITDLDSNIDVPILLGEPPHEKNKAIKLVKQKLLKRTTVQTAVAVTDSKTITSATSITFNAATSVPSNDLLGRCFDQPQPVVKLPNKLDDYLILDIQLQEQDNVLLFWKENAKKFSNIIINCT